MVIAGGGHLVLGFDADPSRFNGAGDGDRRRVRTFFESDVVDVDGFNGAGDGDRRRATLTTSASAPR